MFKKYLSILMLYSALAIMLGHNFIPHHHHFEQSSMSHDGHDHNNAGQTHNHDSDKEPTDWGHLFCNFHHGSSGLIFYSSTLSIGTFIKKDIQTPKLLCHDIYTELLWMDIRQYAPPPYFSPYYNSHYYLPNGLRAPPSHIV
jgi:hypothetical protein